MKFKVEKKGEKFLVVNDTTGRVRGVHSKEGEATAQASSLQRVHDDGIKMASAVIVPQESSE